MQDNFSRVGRKVVVIRNLVLLFAMMLLGQTLLNSTSVHADPGYGSATTTLGFNWQTGVTSDYAEALYVCGDWEVNGDYYFYGRYVWVCPTAIIHGSGTLHLMNPEDNIYYDEMTGPVTIDGNGMTLGINVSIENPYNGVLGNINEDTALSSAQLSNLTVIEEYLGTDGDAHLTVSQQLHFAVSDGDIILGDNNLTLTSTASFEWRNSVTPPLAHIVTNGSGFVIRQSIPTNTSQLYPVGISEASYSPANITNTSQLREIRVRVEDYAASSVVVTDTSTGMDRVWTIMSDIAGDASISLTHEQGSEGSAFSDASSGITMYEGSSLWSNPFQEGGSVDGIYRTHTAVYAITTSDDVSAKFTKLAEIKDGISCVNACTNIIPGAPDSGASTSVSTVPILSVVFGLVALFSILCMDLYHTSKNK